MNRGADWGGAVCDGLPLEHPVTHIDQGLGRLTDVLLQGQNQTLGKLGLTKRPVQ